MLVLFYITLAALIKLFEDSIIIYYFYLVQALSKQNNKKKKNREGGGVKKRRALRNRRKKKINKKPQGFVLAVTRPNQEWLHRKKNYHFPMKHVEAGVHMNLGKIHCNLPKLRFVMTMDFRLFPLLFIKWYVFICIDLNIQSCSTMITKIKSAPCIKAI